MKWQFWFMVVAVLSVIMCILYCALVVASRCDDEEDRRKEDEIE